MHEWDHAIPHIKVDFVCHLVLWEIWVVEAKDEEGCPDHCREEEIWEILIVLSSYEYNYIHKLDLSCYRIIWEVEVPVHHKCGPVWPYLIGIILDIQKSRIDQIYFDCLLLQWNIKCLSLFVWNVWYTNDDSQLFCCLLHALFCFGDHKHFTASSSRAVAHQTFASIYCTSSVI